MYPFFRSFLRLQRVMDRLNRCLPMSLLFVCRFAVAETVMTWQDCVQKTIAANADLAASVAGVEITKAQFTGSYSNFLPQLSASAGYTTSSVEGTVPTPGSPNQVVTYQRQYTESITANQSLFNGFTDVGKIKQARANLRAAEAQLKLEKATLSAALKTNYAQLLYQQQFVDLTDQILERQKRNLRMINLRFQGGSENKGSLLYQQGTVAQATYQHDHAVRQLRNAMKQLGALWGEPDIRDLKIKGQLEWRLPKQIPVYEDITVNNPNHINFEEQRISADAGVKVADGGWYPNLNLIGSIGRVGTQWPPDEDRWSVGVSLTFPFFPAQRRFRPLRARVRLSPKPNSRSIAPTSS